MTFTSINPATGIRIRDEAGLEPEAVRAALEAATAAYHEWRRRPFAARAAPMRAVAGLLRERAGVLALLMAREMGKPVTQGRAEAEKCAWVCEHYAEHAEAMLAPERVDTDPTCSTIAYTPLGPLLAIMPWNFPFWQVFRFAAPNLMAGNTALLKHAPNVPGCALAIEALFRDAGFPAGVFRNAFITHAQAAELIADPAIRGVTLTGSTRAGRAVGEIAGRHLKKCVLELGGSDPYLILEDADLDRAASASATGRLINSGQSCIAAKRFIAVASVHDVFVKRLLEQMAEARMGDPSDEATTLGPLARMDLRDSLERQVAASLAQGARARLGGRVPDMPGAFYPATVLSGVAPGMPAFDEELFGPVAAVIRAEDESAAIALANRSSFGLGAAVFSRDVERATRIATHELEAGAVAINDFVRSDPRLPFGGVKDSGHGRELGRQGILEFVNAKSVSAA